MMERRPDREAYAGEHAVLAEMPMIGWTRPRRSAAQGLGAHRHDATWELCWLSRGEVDWWAGDERRAVAAGQCYLTRPGELHGGEHDLLQPCELFWVQLRLERGRLPGLEVADLAGRLSALPRVFTGDPALSARWADVLRELRDRDRWTAPAIRAALHRLVLTTLRAGERQAASRPSPAIARATAIAGQRLDGRVRVADLARAARLSPSRFHARFIAEVGEAPAAWLRRERLRQAKRLLRAGRPVTEVAHAVGFPTSQWFATVFRRYTGVAPSAWRASATPT